MANIRGGLRRQAAPFSYRPVTAPYGHAQAAPQAVAAVSA